MGDLNVANRTLAIMDNLTFLRRLNNECIDLIAIDPPFAANETFTGKPRPPISDAEYAEEIALAKAHGVEHNEGQGLTRVHDIWSWNEDVHPAWKMGIQDDYPEVFAVIQAVEACASENEAAYIAFMAARLLECRRVLKPAGSIYVHCDDHANGSVALCRVSAHTRRQTMATPTLEEMAAIGRFKEVEAIEGIKEMLDLAKQDLSAMDSIDDDELDIVQFNGREFLRESIDLVEGLLWALSRRNEQVCVHCSRAIAERWTSWKMIVLSSDDPAGEVMKAALDPIKRLRKAMGNLPGYQEAVKEDDDRILAYTGKYLAAHKIAPHLLVGTPDDETDWSNYAMDSVMSHANFTYSKDCHRFDDAPWLWASHAMDSARFFWALRNNIASGVLGGQSPASE